MFRLPHVVNSITAPVNADRLCVVARAQNVSVPCVLAKIRHTLDSKSDRIKEKRPRCIAGTARAVVRIKLARPLPLEKSSDHPRCGCSRCCPLHSLCTAWVSEHCC